MTAVSVEYKGSKITIIVENYIVWFKAADVATILGYVDYENAINTYVNKEDVAVFKINGGSQTAKFVNEAGLCSLIYGSQLPSAKMFNRWIFTEALPAIRKVLKNQSNKKDISIDPSEFERKIRMVENFARSIDKLMKYATDKERRDIMQFYFEKVALIFDPPSSPIVQKATKVTDLPAAVRRMLSYYEPGDLIYEEYMNVIRRNKLLN